MIALAAAMRWQSGADPIGAGHAFDVLPRWPLSAVSAASISVPPD
jgi:hypothetical protein